MTACKLLALAALHASGRRIHVRRGAAAVAADAAAHYLADRRNVTVPSGLPKLACALGKRGFWLLGAPRAGRDDNPCLGTGGHAMDQAFHVACLYLAALIAAGKGQA